MKLPCCDEPECGFFLGLPQTFVHVSEDQLVVKMPVLAGMAHVIKKDGLSYAHVHFNHKASAARFAQAYLTGHEKLTLLDGSPVNVKPGLDRNRQPVKYTDPIANPAHAPAQDPSPSTPPARQPVVNPPQPPQQRDVPPRGKCILVSSHHARVVEKDGEFVLRVQVPTLKLATVVAKGTAMDIEIRGELQEDEEVVLASNEADSLDLWVTFPAPVEEDIDMAFKAGLLTVSFAKQVQQKRMRITFKQ
ncbi:hypothetical protein HDU90_006952 [Geranomyces variabilis]|nr:hypothetical protein HDU90_006952 [Geranomyces variabilis]